MESILTIVTYIASTNSYKKYTFSPKDLKGNSVTPFIQNKFKIHFLL